MKCVSWNVQSIRAKCIDVLEHITDYDADIVFVSETWMDSNINEITAAVKTYDYELLHCRRDGREKELGGGAGIMLKASLNFKQVSNMSFILFEHIIIKLQLGNNTSLLLICIYRLHFISTCVFLDEFNDFLEMLSINYDNFVLSGDKPSFGYK